MAEVKEDNQAKVDNIENKLRQAEIEKTEYAAKE